jgi:hypothetical protein
MPQSGAEEFLRLLIAQAGPEAITDGAAEGADVLGHQQPAPAAQDVGVQHNAPAPQNGLAHVQLYPPSRTPRPWPSPNA